MVARLLAWQWLDEFMPIFGVYALLFADRGLSGAQISLLFVVWSVVSIVVEVPSGAWADVLPRRWLLAAAAVLYGACFAVWIIVPTGWGFAVGFVLWGASGALSSGTFQAFAYDELAAAGASQHYAKVIGWGYSLALAAVTLATLVAAPLFALGGYALVGWVSVAVCAAQLLLVVTMPESPRAISAGDAHELADDLPAASPKPGRPVAGRVAGTAAGPVASSTEPVADAESGTRASDGAGWSATGPSRAWGLWWATLRQGLQVCGREVVVRGAVLASALLMGLLAFDEYFGLLLREHGISTVLIPVLLTVVAGAQAVGALMADRAAAWSPRTAGVVLSVAALLLAAGSAVRHPVAVLGIAIGYGGITLLIVLAEVRLQHVTPSAVRATVTSASNTLAEVLGIGVYLVFVLVDAPVSVLVGVLAAVLVLGGPLLRRWLPTATAASQA